MPSPSPSKGKKRYYSAKTKLSVVMEHKKGTCSAYATAKRHGIQPGQLNRWIQHLPQLKQAVSKRPSKLTVSEGPKVAAPALEAAVLEYCGTLRDSDIAVSTNMLIVKALSIDPTFCGGIRKRLFHWDTSRPKEVEPSHSVVNMDETPVYFEPKVHTTISKKGAMTLSARVCSTHNPRVSGVTATGKKLPPYVVFKEVQVLALMRR
ncbi:hypothetical protein DYB26_013150 [Aphanomyces astaci]|uniref:HTH psq-type domain-containing protein n=1 Tax=Aphanomyces astaci TaxID=112090 RepID=A0A397FDT8_APHAT|nr:hypothetical protein DYB34_005960 [Aphanomyces astaci]RHZ28672.1 hypothetical protein DYB31_015888 [Aphanomyces astaci]RHZ35032.1 hypothetical protein DYB26_013150 [Aphanomyces astaci]